MAGRSTRAMLLDAGAISVGAGVGALFRSAVSNSMRVRSPRHGGYFGTLNVNILGSFVLGVIAASSPIAPRAKLLLGVGLCGGFTTFSTFAVDSIALFESGRASLAFGYITANNVGSIGAAVLGSRVAKSVARKLR